MSDEKLTHWKKTLNYNYLGSHDLDQEEFRDLTVTDVVTEEVVNPRTNEKEDKTVMHFKDSKPMIMNSTNLKAMELITGTPYIEKWVGATVRVKVARVKAFGDMHDALRIDTNAKPVTAAKKLPTMKKDTDEYESMLSWMKSQDDDFDTLFDKASTKYSIPAPVKNALKKEYDAG